MASVDPRRHLSLLDIHECQELKTHEDQLIDILVVLDSTLDTISFLKEKYREFCQDVEPFSAYLANVDVNNGVLEEKQREILLNRKKVEALQTKIQSTMSLVKFFTIFSCVIF